MAKVVVIGAGIMGLAAAYQSLLDGHQVEVLEAAPQAGGMAAHFDLDGLSTERFYHFVCKTDYPTFELLEELNLSSALNWVPTTMGFYSNGTLSKWGDPISLLTYPGLRFMDKLRYGLFAFVCVRKRGWPAIENESAHHWIQRWCGERIYKQFWEALLKFKFYEYAENISARWIWTRIRRIGRSRKNLLQEELGYLNGGSETLVNALMEAIQRLGAEVRLSQPARQVLTESGKVTGVLTPGGKLRCDCVISTAPTPYVSAMVPDLPQSWKNQYEAIHNIGVICVIFKLRKSVTPYFWVNVNDPEFGIPGVIEFSNLRRVGQESVVYVPYYMPITNPKFSWPDAALIAEAFACLQLLNPALVSLDVIASNVTRLKHGQPICEPGFASKLPAVQTPIQGLQIADTCFYYPEDRGIAESIRLGRAMARAL